MTFPIVPNISAIVNNIVKIKKSESVVGKMLLSQFFHSDKLKNYKTGNYIKRKEEEGSSGFGGVLCIKFQEDAHGK